MCRLLHVCTTKTAPDLSINCSSFDRNLSCRHTPLNITVSTGRPDRAPISTAVPTFKTVHRLAKEKSDLVGITQPELQDHGRKLTHSVRAVAGQLLDQHPPSPSAAEVWFAVSGDAAQWKHNAKGEQQTSICIRQKDTSAQDKLLTTTETACMAHILGGDKYENLVSLTRYEPASRLSVSYGSMSTIGADQCLCNTKKIKGRAVHQLLLSTCC